jgi:hypothetical protein
LKEKEERANRTEIANTLWEMEEKPLCVTRQFQCVVCRREFQAKVVVYQSDEIGYTDPEMIPLGEHPL